MTHDLWNDEDYDRAIEAAAEAARAWTRSLPTRRVEKSATLDELRTAFGGELPVTGANPADVVQHLATHGEPGLVASAGPRFFGFVIGGATPASLGADILTSAWDQNAGLYSAAPAPSIIEETAARWVLELLGLPLGSGVGFVTGCQMANTTALAAARHAVLREAGWDVEKHGLQGAPKVHVLTGAGAHATIYTALRLVGLGSETTLVDSDDQGRMIARSLEEKISQCEGPTIVCAQAGNVNTGAFDPFEEICDLAHDRGAWVHVDGAFGLWALASETREHLAADCRAADSWATDAHKWLNVPYDNGIVIVRDRSAHLGATSVRASYLIQAEGDPEAPRDPLDWTPEFSRRGRGVTVWAAIRELGSRGIEEMVDRGCDLATRFAEKISEDERFRVLNDVVLNQVLFEAIPVSGNDKSELNESLVERAQRDGTIWLSGTSWNGSAAIRFSISNWATSEADIDLAAETMIRLLGEDPD